MLRLYRQLSTFLRYRAPYGIPYLPCVNIQAKQQKWRTGGIRQSGIRSKCQISSEGLNTSENYRPARSIVLASLELIISYIYFYLCAKTIHWRVFPIRH